MYYLRTKPAAQAIQFTVDKSKIANVAPKGVSGTAPAAAGDMASMTSNMATLQCSINNQDDCVMCGS